MEHELELSTGFAVGFCYHKAADHRVCQAAHSLSCVRSCSAAAASCPSQQLPETLNKPLTVPLRVWSLTGHEPLRWDRPRCLFDLVQFLFGVWIRLDQIRTRCERFLDCIWISQCHGFCARRTFTTCATYTAHISRGGEAQIYPVRQGPLHTRSICAHYSGSESCGASNRRRILSLLFWSLLTTKLLHLRPRTNRII